MDKSAVSSQQSATIELKDGYLFDYISNLQVKATPEELDAVQIFSRQLVEDYRYPKSHIRTRPQWRVKASPSDTKKEYPVDISVFHNEKHDDDNLSIIVECKQKTRKDGLGQLQDYLRLSKARLGVWFNGIERLFIRKYEKDGVVLFEEIPNIPKFGQRVEDIGQFTREDLIPPHNLKNIFQIIRNHLAGNTVGTTRDEELARQLINLVFCKIYDEKFTEPNSIVEFRVGINEPHSAVRTRIEDLFSKVKGKYTDVIDISDTIGLDDKSIVYIVGELQNYCIIDSERDAVADAFETFIGYALKGGQGQFFTPRNIAQLMTLIGNPTSKELVIDPACGSGGFLVECLKHGWQSIEQNGKRLKWPEKAIIEEQQNFAMKHIHGIEKDDFLSKVAKAYMAILGDGKGGIFCEDSLEEPSQWKPTTRNSISLNKFDLILTNPPFGKDIKIIGDNKLKQYDLAYKWKKDSNGCLFKTNEKRDEQKPDVLFIDRCLQLLKDGGKLGIILPETFFHATSAKYVMEYMAKHNIFYIIDLPHNTFRPHNNAKCIIIFIQKNTKQQDEINMAVAEEMGHDHQGKPIYRWDRIKQKVDKEDLWDDIKLINDEINSKGNTKYTFKVKADLCQKKGIYVPRFYWQQKDAQVKAESITNDFYLKPIQELIDEKVIDWFDGHGSPESENKGNGDVPYIRVKDIVNWEAYKDPTAKIPLAVYKSFTERVKTVNDSEDNETSEVVKIKELKAGDILYVKRGSYRIGSVAMISPYDTEILLTKEINVLRVINPNNKYGITSHYLLYALSTNIVKMQTDSKVLIETTLPNIADRWKQISIPIPNNNADLLNISNRIKGIMDNKWEATKEILSIQKQLGNLTT